MERPLHPPLPRLRQVYVYSFHLAPSHWLAAFDEKGADLTNLLTLRKVHMSPGVSLMDLQHVVTASHRRAARPASEVSTRAGLLIWRQPESQPASRLRSQSCYVCSLCHISSLLTSLVHPDPIMFYFWGRRGGEEECTDLLSRPLFVYSRDNIMTDDSCRITQRKEHVK